MTVVCAWCQKVIRGGGGKPSDVSHGICAACAKAMEAEMAA